MDPRPSPGLNLEASRVGDETVVVRWDRGDGTDLFDVHVDGALVRRGTRSSTHSIDAGRQRKITVRNVTRGASESLVIEDDRRAMYDRLRGGVIDLSRMDETDPSTRGFKEFLAENGETGDVLRVNVEISDRGFSTEARLVKSGDTIQSTSGDNNLYLPFGYREGDQWVKIQAGSGGRSETLRFDGDTETLVVGSDAYGFGESFVVGGRRVVLARGSVVVILEDSLPLAFPEDGIQEEVTLDSGTVAMGVTVASAFLQVREKEEVGDTSVSSHVLMLDPATDERLVVTEIDKSVDDSLTLGRCTWRTAGPDKSLVDTLDYDASGVRIHSVSGTVLNSSRVDTTGLSFSSNDSSIFFGSSSQVRLAYSDDKILVQFRDGDTGEYVTKTQFER